MHFLHSAQWQYKIACDGKEITIDYNQGMFGNPSIYINK